MSKNLVVELPIKTVASSWIRESSIASSKVWNPPYSTGTPPPAFFMDNKILIITNANKNMGWHINIGWNIVLGQ